LPKGDVTEGVVRVGATVRRPHSAGSFAVARYLDHLERAGFTGSPRFLGLDDRGRDVLTFMAGEVGAASPEPWVADDDLLVSVAELVTQLLSAAVGFDVDQRWFPPRDGVGEATVVTHLDITPQNVVVRDGRAVALIDFDLTRRATPYDEGSNTAMHWVPLRDPADVYPRWAGIDQPRRLRIFADAFGMDAAARSRFVADQIERADATWHRMKQRAEDDGGGWARMWDEGVGDQIRRRQRWLGDQHDVLTRALLET
jgi:hypothetical protein